MNEPILGKRKSRPDDYKKLEIKDIITLIHAAQDTANTFGYPVYLVGSVTYKEVPRDIDISVIIPLNKYEKIFGKLPTDQIDYSRYLGNVDIKSYKYVHFLYFCIDDYDLDIKVCPDTWWPEKPKILLTSPQSLIIVKLKTFWHYISLVFRRILIK